MTDEQYTEFIQLLGQVGVYSEYMGRSSNADEWQRNYTKFDDARQKIITLARSLRDHESG